MISKIKGLSTRSYRSYNRVIRVGYNVYETTQFTYEPYPVYVRDEGAVVTNDALTPIMDCL